MQKKTYIQPIINIIRLQYQQPLLEVSGIATTSTSSDVELTYEESGGDAADAW